MIDFQLYREQYNIIIKGGYEMPKVNDRMHKDLVDKDSRIEASVSSEKEIELNAFERLGKDVVIIEILAIMNIIFAVCTVGLIGALIYSNNN